MCNILLSGGSSDDAAVQALAQFNAVFNNFTGVCKIIVFPLMLCMLDLSFSYNSYNNSKHAQK